MQRWLGNHRMPDGRKPTRGFRADRLARGLALFAILSIGALPFAAGCRHESAGAASPTENQAPADSGPKVRVVSPELRSITHTVGQPGFVEAYEQTAIYSKVSGFIKKFYVDIGDQVTKGQLLCEEFVPELEEEHQRKLAQVRLDREMIVQAQRLVDVAASNIQTAMAQVNEAKANVGKYQADVVRWESEVKRLTQIVKDRVVDKQVLDETQRQLDSTISAKEAAQAAVAAREAARVSSEADLAKAKVDVEVAKAKVQVSEADERQAAALLAYTKVTSPYDGVITVRNANTGDYVQAATGDKENSKGVPIFVVARTDIVRIYVDIPEAYAHYVRPKTRAEVRAVELDGLEIPATVTRTSWSLSEKTRTLRAEIDLPIKPDDGLRPGTYVYGKVIIEQPKLRVLPDHAITVEGNQTFCYLLIDGKAIRTQIQRGIGDGTWIEVLKKKVGASWQPMTGDENVIVGDLTAIADGQNVNAATSNAPQRSPSS
jgi:HlyD family secretion protein